MTASIPLGRFGAIAALLTTVALPATVIAATTTNQVDEGVSVAVTSEDAAAPRLTMMRRGDMAGEDFASGPSEVIELLLSDGTTLTLGAAARLSVDRYAYDKQTGRGELAMTLKQGVLKIVGGSLNNTAPILVRTPGGEVTLDNATAVIVVEEDGATSAALDYGRSVVLTTADGEQAKIVKPGFEVAVTSDGDISGPYRRAPGNAIKIARALNPGLVTGIAPVAEVETETEPAPEQVALAAPEEEAAAGEDVEQVADETTAQIDDDLTDTRAEAGVFDDTGAGGVLVNALGFDAGDDVGLLDTGAETPSQTSTDLRSLAQNRDPRLQEGEGSPNLTLREDEDDLSEEEAQSDRIRPRGLTTNTIVTSNEAMTVDLASEGDSVPERAKFFSLFDDQEGERSDLQYVFFGRGFGLDGEPFVVSDKLALTFEGGEVNAGGFLVFASKQIEGVAITDTLIPRDGKVGSQFVGQTVGSDIDENDFRGTLLGSTMNNVLQSGFSLVSVRDIEGTIYEGYDFPSDDGIVVDRKLDNFIILEFKPAIVTNLDALRFRFDIDALHKSPALLREFAAVLGLTDASIIDDRPHVILELADVLLNNENDPEINEKIGNIDGLEDDQQVLDYIRSPVANPFVNPNETETFIFAAGDVDSAPDPERRLDVYALSPGLDGLNEDGELEDGGVVAPSIRAFLRNATAFREEDGSGGIPIGDSGLMIIGRPAGSIEGLGTDEQSALLHADIGIDGEGVDQRSTVSVTIGDVQYDAGLSGEEVMLDGRTVGSTQDLGTGASTLAGGDIFNTAAGGGRAVDTDGDGIADSRVDGRATYFVIENFDPDGGDHQGGQERPVGAPERDSDFAFLRLATGKSSTSTDALPSEGGTFDGFAAGMLERGGNDDQVQVSPESDRFAMTLDPSTNRMAVSDLTIGDQTLQLSGLGGEGTKGQSAYIDDNRFAARSDGDASDVAFVSGGVLQQAASTLPEDDAARKFLDVPDYKHLKWGFFFGDVDTGRDGGEREHVHLGSWVAGNVLTAQDASRLPTNGTATYSGHAFGNVVNGGALYAARGTFTNRWNFGSRAGLAELGFDGAVLKGLTRLEKRTLMFSGALEGDDRTAGIIGAFIRGDEAAGQPPAGQIGEFQILGGGYNAKGTFGAERQ